MSKPKPITRGGESLRRHRSDHRNMKKMVEEQRESNGLQKSVGPKNAWPKDDEEFWRKIFEANGIINKNDTTTLHSDIVNCDKLWKRLKIESILADERHSEFFEEILESDLLTEEEKTAIIFNIDALGTSKIYKLLNDDFHEITEQFSNDGRKAISKWVVKTCLNQ